MILTNLLLIAILGLANSPEVALEKASGASISSQDEVLYTFQVVLQELAEDGSTKLLRVPSEASLPLDKAMLEAETVATRGFWMPLGKEAVFYPASRVVRVVVYRASLTKS